MRTLSAIFIFLACWLCLRPAYAFDDTMLESLQQNMKDLQKVVQSLQVTVENQNEVIRKQAVKIDALEKTREGAPPQASASMPAAAPKVAGVQGFNPEIGVTGTVQGKLTESPVDGEGNDTVALKELELNFAQVVDPFSRLDAIISFNDAIENQNVAIEEAYYTRWGLPFGFTAQAGKFRSKIGKENLMHLHQLDTTDYPLVIRDFFGEEGLASSGVRLQNTIPNPLDIPIEVTGEVLRGNNGPSFSGISRRPIFNTHLKTYFEPAKDTNLEMGWTTLLDSSGVKVYGGDVTFNWFLPEGKKVKLQNELYFQNRGNVRHVNDNPWGFYSLLDYKFSQKFSTGVRFDYLQPLDVVGQHVQSIGISPYLTFWQSEFADFKLQYSHLEPANSSAKADNMIFLQADFLIGAHKHPVQ